MNSDRVRKIVLAARPNGRPRLTDFRLEEADLPMPGSGQILLCVQYLSLDPYMRGRMDDRKSYAEPLQLGDVMIGQAVAQVIASNRPGNSEGDIVLAQTGGGALTRSRTAPAFASSIPPSRQLLPH